MISVQLNGQRFQVRAAAIILHEDFVLLHRAPSDDHWALPGGRVEVGESASTTIVRELMEELGENVECGPLLHVVENFYELAGARNHEIGFYFQVCLAEPSIFLDTSRTYRGVEPELSLEFRWFPLQELVSVNLRPAFLRTYLSASPLVFGHAVCK